MPSRTASATRAPATCPAAAYWTTGAPLRTVTLTRRLQAGTRGVMTPLMRKPTDTPIRLRIYDRKRRLPLPHIQHDQRPAAVDRGHIEMVRAPEQGQLRKVQSDIELV